MKSSPTLDFRLLLSVLALVTMKDWIPCCDICMALAVVRTGGLPITDARDCAGMCRILVPSLDVTICVVIVGGEGTECISCDGDRGCCDNGDCC